MKKLRITGGERGFKAAVRDALHGNGRKMHSPGVYWTRERGFYTASTLCGDEGLLIWTAGFNANSGKPYCLPDYDEQSRHDQRLTTGSELNYVRRETTNCVKP